MPVNWQPSTGGWPKKRNEVFGVGASETQLDAVVMDRRHGIQKLAPAGVPAVQERARRS